MMANMRCKVNKSRKQKGTLHKDMAFSTERYKDKDYDGPFAVEFHGVAVAGK
jgi:hypothetical protein